MPNDYPVEILPGHKANFETLQQAMAGGDVCIASCLDNMTQTSVAVVCAVTVHPNGDRTLVPLAKLFDGNPYEELTPP